VIESKRGSFNVTPWFFTIAARSAPKPVLATQALTTVRELVTPAHPSLGGFRTLCAWIAQAHPIRDMDAAGANLLPEATHTFRDRRWPTRLLRLMRKAANEGGSSQAKQSFGHLTPVPPYRERVRKRVESPIIHDRYPQFDDGVGFVGPARRTICLAWEHARQVEESWCLCLDACAPEAGRNDRMHPTQSDTQRSAVRGFYIHAAVFAIVNLALIAVNRIRTPHYFWAKWVLLDWGAGLATHAWIVFRSEGAHRVFDQE
jgi:hypothetical protein